MGEKEKTQEIQTNEKESNTGVNRTVADCSDSGRRCGRFFFKAIITVEGRTGFKRNIRD